MGEVKEGIIRYQERIADTTVQKGQTFSADSGEPLTVEKLLQRLEERVNTLCFYQSEVQRQRGNVMLAYRKLDPGQIPQSLQARIDFLFCQ